MSDPPRVVRLAVAVQRRPALAATIVSASLMLLAFVASIGSNDRPLIGFFVFATCASTAVAEIGARATSLWGRIAFTGIGAGVTYPLYCVAFPSDAHDPTLVLFVAAAMAMPHATVAVASRASALGTRTALLLFVALAIGVPLLVSVVKRSGSPIAILVAWVLTLQLAFRAAAVTGVPVRRLLAGATVAGATSGLLIAAEGNSGDWYEWTLALAISWGLSAALVPLARTGRSFTAVPLEHPLCKDLAGPGPA